jgi:hypothetical protein
MNRKSYMRFNRHSDLEGRHSFLSPSKYAWLRYDDSKLERVFMEHLAHLRGTEEHDFAARAIKLGHRLPDEPKTMNLYVNDCIGWRMKPEVPLYWSDFCFGTADALGYQESTRTLRISDLKTGKSPTKVDQLVIYAALFCLEYEFPKPWELEIELRIYQSNRVMFYPGDPDEIFHAMDRILTGTRLLEQIRSEYQS